MGRGGLALLVSSIIALSSPATAFAKEILPISDPEPKKYIASLEQPKMDDLVNSYPIQTNEEIEESIDSSSLISQAIYSREGGATTYTLPFPNPLPIELKSDEVLSSYNKIIDYRDSHTKGELINSEFDRAKKKELIKGVVSSLLNSGFDYVTIKKSCWIFCRTIEAGKDGAVYKAKVNVWDALYNLKSEHIVEAFNLSQTLSDGCDKYKVVEMCVSDSR